MLALGLVLIFSTVNKYRVSRSGQTVKVVLIELPRCTGYKHNFVKFNYKGVDYSQRVKCKFVRQYRPGDEVEMLHSEGTTIFLFKSENVSVDFAYLGVLMAVGIISIVLGYRRQT